MLAAIESKDADQVKATLHDETVWIAEPGVIEGLDAIVKHLMGLTLPAHARIAAHGSHVVVRTPEWSAALEVRKDGIVFGAQFNS